MSRRAAFVVVLLGAAVCFAVALARALSVPLSSDIAWQVFIADALAGGARLGHDVIEVNPPLAAWLEIPVVRLAALAGATTAVGHEVAVLLLGMLSVLLTALCARHVAILRRAESLLAFCLLTALALALQPGLEVGQREHLAILLVVPHFVLLAARLERAPVPAGLPLAVGVAAGLGFALKPFFLLPLALGELLVMRERRALRAVLRPETLCIGAVFALYALAIVVAAPGWLATAREFWPLYGSYRPATLDEVVTRQGVVLLLAALALAAWAVSRRAADPHSRLGDALAAALAGFVVAMLAQRKPWIYLAVPSGVLALASLSVTVLETSGRMRTAAGRLLRAALVLVVALRVGRYLWWLLHAPVVSMTDRVALADYTRLRAALDSLPAGTTMGSLSPTHGVTFPLVLDVQGRWMMRLPSLWPAISSAAQDVATQDRLRRLVVEDVNRGRPEVLLVLEPATVYAWLGPLAQRDWQQWLAESPDGAAALRPYRPWFTVGEFRVLRRERPAP
ncbi:MAG TPA: hypothetical protein VFY20_01040 [Gemmatimonadales bacterium]|nr:hypothetical protein [Gemmatimonadales bacterium]